MKNFRTFKRVQTSFLHPGTNSLPKAERPDLMNMNLVLGGNGSGKTTLLKGIAIAALGPAAPVSGLFPYHLVRRELGQTVMRTALIKADFTPNLQDREDGSRGDVDRLQSSIRIQCRGDLEQFVWMRDRRQSLATDLQRSFGRVLFRRLRRQPPRGENGTASTKEAGGPRLSCERDGSQASSRKTYSLIPLSHWLPRYEAANPGRFVQVRDLINRLLGPAQVSVYR